MFDSNKIQIGSEITFQNWSGEKRTGKVTRFIDGGSYEVQTKFATVMVDPDEIVEVVKYAEGGSINVPEIKIGSNITFIAGFSQEKRSGTVTNVIAPGMYEVTAGFGKVLVDSDEIISVEQYALGGVTTELSNKKKSDFKVIFKETDKDRGKIVLPIGFVNKTTWDVTFVEVTFYKIHSDLYSFGIYGVINFHIKAENVEKAIDLAIKRLKNIFLREYMQSPYGKKFVITGFKYNELNVEIPFTPSFMENTHTKQIITDRTFQTKPGDILRFDASGDGFDFYYVVDEDGNRISDRLKGKILPSMLGDGIITLKKQYAEGGSIEMQNYEMVKNNNKAIAHHSKELDSVLVKNKKVPAWVVAKVYSASTDLSDVTHYLDGAKFEDGGKIQEYNGTKYLSWDFENKGNKWNITVVWGKVNYISVLKKTNNPFGGRMGKDFKSIDEAIANYKDPNIQANIIFAVDEAKKNGMPDQFAKGGYVRPSFDIKTSGIYKFKTTEKEYTIQSYMFERKGDDSDSLEIQDELRGELGSIVIKNNAWKNLSSGKSINAVSETGKKGKLTRIDDTKNVSKYFKEGGVTDQNNVVKVGDVWKIKKSANKFWQKLTKGNIYQDLTFPSKDEAEAWLNKKPTFAKGGGVQYKDLSTQKDPVINDSKNKFSEKKNDVPEIDIVFKKAVEFDSYPKITNADTASEVFRKFWDSKRINIQEAFYVMHLNNANNVISVYAPFKGGITSTVADIELICATAIKSLAKAVIICHNHPSGQLKFSEADINLTKNLSTALKIVNIDLLDSMVLTETDYISMADQGINFAPKQI